MNTAGSVVGVQVSAYGVGAGFCCIRFAIICAADCDVGKATAAAGADAAEVPVDKAAVEGSLASVLADVAGREESVTLAGLVAGSTEEDTRFPCEAVETAEVTEL